MRSAIPAGLLCLLASVPNPSQAQAPQALSPLPPAPFQFTGSWNCQGAFANGRTHRASFTGTLILGGKWLQLNETDIEPATGYLAQYLLGFDPQSKRLVEFDANNFGAATYTSDTGWLNGALTVTSPVTEAPGQPYAANRFLYTVVGNDEFHVDWQVSKTATLDWHPGDHLVCKRTP